MAVARAKPGLHVNHGRRGAGARVAPPLALSLGPTGLIHDNTQPAKNAMRLCMHQTKNPYIDDQVERVHEKLLPHASMFESIRALFSSIIFYKKI
jgi:hypothetical protein